MILFCLLECVLLVKNQKKILTDSIYFHTSE